MTTGVDAEAGGDRGASLDVWSRFERVEGAKYREQDQKIMIDPGANTWSVVWG